MGRHEDHVRRVVADRLGDDNAADVLDDLRAADLIVVEACPVRTGPDHLHHGERRVLTGRLFGPSEAEEPTGEEWCDGTHTFAVPLGELGPDGQPVAPPPDDDEEPF